jgi:hypothetical protein
LVSLYWYTVMHGHYTDILWCTVTILIYCDARSLYWYTVMYGQRISYETDKRFVSRRHLVTDGPIWPDAIWSPHKTFFTPPREPKTHYGAGQWLQFLEHCKFLAGSASDCCLSKDPVPRSKLESIWQVYRELLESLRQLYFENRTGARYTVSSESRCALTKVLEVMSTSVYTGLNPFNFIRKHFLKIRVRKVAVRL